MQATGKALCFSSQQRCVCAAFLEALFWETPRESGTRFFPMGKLRSLEPFSLNLRDSSLYLAGPHFPRI